MGSHARDAAAVSAARIGAIPAAPFFSGTQRGYSAHMSRIHGLIPMAHVLDVRRSIAFYNGKLGFVVRNTLEHGGRTAWAALESGVANLMLAAADGPVPADQQAVLFYLYCDDVHALRRDLLAAGLADGGAYCGAAGPGDGCCVVFEPTYPGYMEKGEIRVHDPDGYCLLIGQDE